LADNPCKWTLTTTKLRSVISSPIRVLNQDICIVLDASKHQVVDTLIEEFDKGKKKRKASDKNNSVYHSRGRTEESGLILISKLERLERPKAINQIFMKSL
jgi:hypothetical protein